MHNPRYQIGPSHTPFIIKALLLITAIVSLLCSFQISFFPGVPLHFWLSLSWIGFKQGLFFQPLTYYFVVASYGLSLGFLFNLLVHLYMLWIFGVSLVERFGVNKFLILFFGSGILSGIVALIIMSMGYHFYQLAGSTTVIYGYLMSWVMLNPHSQIRLFFTVPLKTKWLILGILGFNLLTDLSRWDFVLFFSYLTAASFGYFFTLIYSLTHSPFSFLHKMEKKVLHFFQARKEKKLKTKPFKESKVYDIKTGKAVLKDDEFMDAMLNKISLYGEGSLTRREKRRMKKISKERKDKD